MTALDRLFVLWADPGSGARHVIGELWRAGPSSYRFAYGHEIAAACAHGFRLMTEFPVLRKADMPFEADHLFSTFAQRIPSRKRFDFDAMMHAWGVRDPGDPLEILARSGGVRLTDPIELAEYRPATDDLATPLSFRVAGMRHQGEAGAQSLQSGDPVDLVRESDNAFDPSATRVMTRAGHRLGYVPRQYSPIVARLLDDGVPIEAVAERLVRLPDEGARWVVCAKALEPQARSPGQEVP